MSANIDRFKNDLEALDKLGDSLLLAFFLNESPEGFENQFRPYHKDDSAYKAFKKGLPNYKAEYQRWYSEALAVIRQLIPERIQDFTRLHDRPKTRKELSFENYTIEDALQGLQAVRSHDRTRVVGPDAAIPKFEQQLAILRSAKSRFASSLFDIRQTLQADIFDSELEAASHLLKRGFGRAAGAVAGVLIEKHLAEVSSTHSVPQKKKDPTIADLNESLKAAGVIEVPIWRFIQHLADIRNLCDHNKGKEPTGEQVRDLLDGVAKLIKTVS